LQRGEIPLSGTDYAYYIYEKIDPPNWDVSGRPGTRLKP